MIITVDEYKSMGFPVVNEENITGCILRSGYIISGLTNGNAEAILEKGGKPAELVKQAAGFQTFQLLMEMEKSEKVTEERSGNEKVSIGDYSYSNQSSESSSSEASNVDNDTAGVNIIRLLRAAGCLYCGVEVIE